MKSTLLTLFIIPFFFSTTNNDNSNTTNTVVLELFTSQGCSSCPPADQILNQVKGDNVIALSYHVDYWNYIGWKDPFSKATYSNKQRKYATKFNSSTIYTPQLVINGKEHIVGSKRKLVNDKISEYSKKNSQSKIVITAIAKTENLIEFNYKFEGIIDEKNIRSVLVINERTTNVKRGENRNRTLVNANIVVEEQQFKLSNDIGKGSITIPNIVNTKDQLFLALIVEDKSLNIDAATLKLL